MDAKAASSKQVQGLWPIITDAAHRIATYPIFEGYTLWSLY